MSKVKSQKSKVEINIDYLAKLANLELLANEKAIFAKQLSQILEYVKQIESQDTKNTEPTYNISSNKNVTRSDITGRSLSQEEALQNAKATKNGQFATKGVFVK